jgi:HSP20 family protein
MAHFEFEPEERFRSAWGPVIDVLESPDDVTLRVELPGVNKEDIRLRWRDGLLAITGVKPRQVAPEAGMRYLCVERQYGEFRRDIAIGTPIDFERCSARLVDGLLHIRLPKMNRQRGDAFIPIEE